MPSIKPKTAISALDILGSSASGRIIFLKLIDRIAGFFIILIIQGLLLFKPKKAGPVPDKIKNVLLIRPGGIGDAVWVLPLIRMLKQKTGCSVDVLCERRNNAVFNFCREDIRNIWMYDDRGLKLIKDLTGQDYDCVIDTEQYHNFSAIFAYLASSRCRIGFDTVPYRSKLYTHKVPYSHQAQEYKMFLDLFNVLIPIKSEEYLQHKGLELSKTDMLLPPDLKEQRFLTVYIGASVRERYWGSVKFAQLSSELVELGYRVVLVGGKEDIKKAGEIKLHFSNDKMTDLVGKITLAQTAAVLKQGLLAIGADSGIMHLASAVNCPAVWLFGAGIEKKWLPEYSRHGSINLHLSCSPCTLFGCTPRCPYDVRCLKEISVDQVVDKIKILLKNPSH
jgi:ADP-heptose:LPS heptosyltransferase